MSNKSSARAMAPTWRSAITWEHEKERLSSSTDLVSRAIRSAHHRRQRLSIVRCERKATPAHEKDFRHQAGEAPGVDKWLTEEVATHSDF